MANVYFTIGKPAEMRITSLTLPEVETQIKQNPEEGCLTRLWFDVSTGHLGRCRDERTDATRILRPGLLVEDLLTRSHTKKPVDLMGPARPGRETPDRGERTWRRPPPDFLLFCVSDG